MAWQDTFSAVFGPGLFAGVPVANWLRVLWANGFRIDPRCLPRCLTVSAASLANTPCGTLERGLYGRCIDRQTIPPPLFVLGHWRSGTTHLHNLLSRDERFAFPSLYQVLYPHTFLTTEAITSRLLSPVMPRTRFGMDNVAIGWSVPYEDEFAIAAISQLSPYLTMAFPRRQRHYDRFLTMADARPEEIDCWKATLTAFLRKLAYKHGRPLILKSPTHTCRIALLLELFPDARFVHIRRNPFHVYNSMKRMLGTALRFWRLQNPGCVDWEDRAVRQYREMYETYFRQRDLIPGGHFHEVSFEALEADPIGQVRDIYAALQLADFDPFEPKLRRYVATLSGYQKNSVLEIAPAIRERIVDRWRTCFDAWGYSTSGE